MTFSHTRSYASFARTNLSGCCNLLSNHLLLWKRDKEEHENANDSHHQEHKQLFETLQASCMLLLLNQPIVFFLLFKKKITSSKSYNEAHAIFKTDLMQLHLVRIFFFNISLKNMILITLTHLILTTSIKLFVTAFPKKHTFLLDFFRVSGFESGSGTRLAT